MITFSLSYLPSTDLTEGETPFAEVFEMHPEYQTALYTVTGHDTACQGA